MGVQTLAPTLRVKTSVSSRVARILKKLETYRTVAHGKLEMTQPTLLGLLGRAVVNL